MATLFVFLVNATGAPLTGASPTFDYWDKSSPGTPQATGVGMTELTGGIGGCYFADVATTDGREYIAVIDGTASASPRYQRVAFSGETDARIETDVPAILVDTAAMQPLVDVAISTRSSHSAADVDTVLSGTHGGGSWEGAAASIPAIVAAVWGELLPGAFGAGEAGNIVGNNLDVAVSSRESEASASARASTDQAEHDATQADIAALNDLSSADVQAAMTAQGYTVARAALLDNLSDLDASISSVIAAIGALNDLSSADVQAAMTAQGYTVARAALLDNLDAAISTAIAAIGALNDLGSADVTAVLDAQGLTAARAALLDNLDAAISTVLSTGGPGPWTTAAAGSGLTAAQAAQLFYVWTHAGGDPANKMNHTRAIIGTPGRAFSDDNLVDQVVTQVDNDSATFEQQ